MQGEAIRMRRFNLVPDIGWTYPINDHVSITGGHYEDLVEKVRQYYRANNKNQPADLEEQIQEFLCKHLPKKYCTGQPDRMPSWSMIANGTMIILELVKHGRKIFVDQQRAEARALVCVNGAEGNGCTANQKTDACAACKGLYGLIEQWFGDRETLRDKNLHVCLVCRCLNRAQVHVKTEVLAKVTAPGELEKYPRHCWKRIELTEYYHGRKN